MAVATVAGFTMKFTDFRETTPDVAGEVERTFSNTLVNSIRTPKRTFTGTHLPATLAEMAGFRTAVANRVPVLCMGGVFGGTLTCSVQVKDIPYDRARTKTSDHTANADGFEIALSMDFQEV